MKSLLIKTSFISLLFLTVIPSAISALEPSVDDIRSAISHIKAHLGELETKKEAAKKETKPKPELTPKAKAGNTGDTPKIIKMPNAQVLQARLSKLGFDDFMKSTNLVRQLADKEKYPQGVVMAVALSYADYNEDLKKGSSERTVHMLMTQMNINKGMLFKALLRDEPEALQNLKKLGFLN